MPRWVDGLGFEHIWNKRARHHRKNIGAENETYENPMMFALRGRLSRGSFAVHLEMSADPGINGVRIEREFIKLPANHLVQRDRRGHATISRDSESERQESLHPFESATPREFASLVGSWQFLSLDPGRMGMPIRQTMAPAPCKLYRDGSNLGQYLWEIRHQDLFAFEGILEALRFVLPFSSDIQPRSYPGDRAFGPFADDRSGL